MPQIFNVLRCYKCFVFQIHQIKKSNKWECKMCGEKQSIKRHYGIGTSKDCRLYVQKLNLLQSHKHSDSDILSDDNSDDSDHDENLFQNIPPVPPAKVSKWSHYIDEHDIKYTKEKTKTKPIEECDEFVNEINDRKVHNRKIGNNKKSSKFVSPNKEEYPCIGINKISECTNDGQIINKTKYWEPASSLNEQYNDWRNNNCIENKIINNKPMISSSKWASFLDGEGLPSSLELNLSSNVIKGKSDVEESASKLHKNQQSTTSSILKSNDTNLESLNSNVTLCKQSMFSMSNDRDLDSILDF